MGQVTIPTDIFLNSPKVNTQCMTDTSAYNCAVNNGHSYTLYDKISSTSVKFAHDSYTMLQGTTMKLYPIFAPENSTDKVSWIIGNKNIVDIDEQNVVTAKSNGLVTVRCTTDSGKTCTFSIEVVASGDVTVETEPVKDITLSTITNLQDADYTGAQTSQKLKVMFNPCTELVPRLDDELSYANNIDIGTATVTITGKGNYKGTITKNYKIKEAVTYGDVNGDGNIDIADALKIYQYDAQLVEFDSKEIMAGDVNKDGETNIADAIVISQYDAGLISGF